MDKDTLEKRIKTVMEKIINVEAAKINEETSSGKVKRWDSLRHMNLVLALEQEFGVQFDDNQIPKMLSYKDILQTIQSKTAGAH